MPTEAPAGVRNVSFYGGCDYDEPVYTAEQMARLGVDEDGKAAAVQTLGAPARRHLSSNCLRRRCAALRCAALRLSPSHARQRGH